MSSPTETIDAAVLRDWGLPDPGDSKQTRGDVAIVGASRRTPGAVMLAFEAALRVGAGRVALLVPGSVEGQMGAHLPEAAVFALPDDPREAITGGAADALEHADAVLVGPGFDDVPQTRATLDAVLSARPPRLVLDAYALAVLPDIPRRRLPADLVLTPNDAEAAMLLGATPPDDTSERGADEREATLVEVARRFDAVVASYGIAATAAGTTRRIQGGVPGLATAGSGDVLAGAIAGFLARGIPTDRAAGWGLWSHARAGDRLAELDGLGFLARELARELARAVHEVDGLG